MLNDLFMEKVTGLIVVVNGALKYLSVPGGWQEE
jgi:hypothetical protein